MAAVRDELHVLHWLYASAHAEKGKPPKWKPERFPRPGVTTRSKAQPTTQQIDVLAEHLRRTQGGEYN